MAGHQVKCEVRESRVTYLTSNQFAIVRGIGYNWGMGKTKRTPEQREAMMYAFWNKWGGGDPKKVKRTKGIQPSPWDREEKD